MSPLAFVNWRSVNARFCLLMWLVAAVLGIVILMHAGPARAGHHTTTATARRAAAAHRALLK